jgi:hypothetical protein
MAQYAQDAMETDRPWERWEYYNESSRQWCSLRRHPSWYLASQYRRKPRTININGFDVPEPAREPLERGQQYYAPNITGCAQIWMGCTWEGNHVDKCWLARGLIHLTKEAASIHSKALLSFAITQP